MYTMNELTKINQEFILHHYDLTALHFYFDYNGGLIIDNVYKNMRNYKTYRHIKKYAENKLLINAMMQIKGGFETCEK